MDPFASAPSSLAGSQPSNDQMMDQLKQQLAQAYAEEFFTVRFFASTPLHSLPTSSKCEAVSLHQKARLFL